MLEALETSSLEYLCIDNIGGGDDLFYAAAGKAVYIVSCTHTPNLIQNSCLKQI
ncbi:uncharacterized protein PHALS_14464 [Plasmopara halstedii]|uniref:Uncharacterized protein n=1 Tax=Plasmopara halstedii TaxID=4781 RepID=A0A0P1AS71_PLAHL|nr:uncharacterized protein PHALS_14464 [Plasmopara halstedii]CEG44206.1 hypothetical protein PHALS_14464 [Plasmopara halstedii]|eukprot:XP_024580575.1 hypothetical protein PHALS_14464 [Plasmopara halstedii]